MFWFGVSRDCGAQVLLRGAIGADRCNASPVELFGDGQLLLSLDLPELRDIDRHLAAYGAHARSELERVTSLLVELLSQDLTEEHAGL